MARRPLVTRVGRVVNRQFTLKLVRVGLDHLTEAILAIDPAAAEADGPERLRVAWPGVAEEALAAALADENDALELGHAGARTERLSSLLRSSTSRSTS